MDQNQDVVYGLLRCKSGISNQSCEACGNTAVRDMRELCPSEKEASSSYIDCSLHYSNLNFFSTADSIPRVVLWNPENATDQVLFNRQLGNLLRDLTPEATSISSRFSLGSTTFIDFEQIYAVVQHTKLLTEDSCFTCLQIIIHYIPVCCDGKLGKESSSKTIVSLVVPLAVSGTIIPIICGFLLWKKANRRGAGTLRLATQNFSDANKLGQGGFGPVYKGQLSDGCDIAVKRLQSTSGQGLAELKTEAMLVAKQLHRNLVRLLGFCLEDKEKLIVYEYLANGSLDKILFDEGKRFQLDWERRYKIIVGIAQGLLYLHEDSQLRIGHRDLKASNILLDEKMNPKISDFSLAKLFGGSQTQGRQIVLRLGWFNSSKVCQHWCKETALAIMDPALGDQWPSHDVLKCINVGLLCVQEAATDRPTMSDIMMMLSRYAVTSRLPSEPAFLVPEERSGSNLVRKSPGVSQSDEANPELLQQSVNEVTMTDLEPR
ncbi:Cysteine rich receptor like kinase [Quillaja saponaria]|uniref:non-specific serine/threonine protein kinase n=1 Tax=Quillaja saponaria TaxID=32244 RepID=A0AAD7KYF6_QUISA|nr:Cysteine rich receptor like kinase [Quillaja saponaria]